MSLLRFPPQVIGGQYLPLRVGDAQNQVCHFFREVSLRVKVPGVKNALLGGEGLFNTLLTGPGTVWLQTMPICNVAMSIRPYIPTGNG